MPGSVRQGSGHSGSGRGESAARTGAQTGVESIDTGMRLLLAFVELGGRGQMLKVLAEAAHMPSSKAHRYLVSLIRMGFVDRDPATGHYRLGPKAVQVGVSALGSIDAIALSGEEMVRLHDELDHTMALTVWGSGNPVIVRVEEADRLMTVGFRIGKSLPILTSASGQLFAAFLPREDARGAIRGDERWPAGWLWTASCTRSGSWSCRGTSRPAGSIRCSRSRPTT